MRSGLQAAMVRVAVGALVAVSGVAGAAAPAVAAGSICPVPKPIAKPVVTRIVGTGTATSCTQASVRRAVAAGGSVSFNCGTKPVTIRIDSVLPVTKTTVIDGGHRVSLDAHGASRLLDVADNTTLSVRNLTLVNAASKQGDPDKGSGGAISGGYHVRVEVFGSTLAHNTSIYGGGAIYVGNDSRLTISASTLTSNRAKLGGAIYSLLSTLTVSGSTLTKNRAAGDAGGAVLTDGASPRDAAKGGTISVCRSTIASNASTLDGGGAYLWGYQKDRIVVYRSTFSSNTAGGTTKGGSLGGGARVSIAQEGGATRTGSIVLSRVAFVKNRSSSNGGGMYLDCAPGCSIRNATFSQNTSANFGGAIAGSGHHDNGVTYVGNRAQAGGALAGTGVVLQNTVFSGNTATQPYYASCIESHAGTNVLQWGSGARDTGQPCVANAIQKDPRLGAVKQNGGGVPTAMPGTGSAALGRGTTCLPTDARSVTRPAKCDLGAAERTK